MPIKSSIDDYWEKRAEKSPEFRRLKAKSDLAFPLAVKIIALRDKAGLTQKELATLVGTSQSAIARLENGDTIPTVQTLNKIAKALHQKVRIDFVPEDEVLYN
ncbi:Helix-turn-helix [Pilibacter termitis]|uniref:Helix-turn-helix n=1 Tax=Pilibacter termitis TaxID=263852 RepID=A0A1T4KSB0_9ENTE|nr:helix-turn-helix transcriptional regulator [Pilibacter termitis]SJZ45263.1 Helix-turn-helix [Pilibacter termitis]